MLLGKARDGNEVIVWNRPLFQDEGAVFRAPYSEELNAAPKSLGLFSQESVVIPFDQNLYNRLRTLNHRAAKSGAEGEKNLFLLEKERREAPDDAEKERVLMNYYRTAGDALLAAAGFDEKAKQIIAAWVEKNYPYKKAADELKALPLGSTLRELGNRYKTLAKEKAKVVRESDAEKESVENYHRKYAQAKQAYVQAYSEKTWEENVSVKLSVPTASFLKSIRHPGESIDEAIFRLVASERLAELLGKAGTKEYRCLPAHTYEEPVLVALLMLGGGKGTLKKHLYPAVQALFRNQFTHDDLEKVGKNSRRWMNTVRWTKLPLRQKGLLKDSKPGVWELTPKGRKAAGEALANNPEFYSRLSHLASAK